VVRRSFAFFGRDRRIQTHYAGVVPAEARPDDPNQAIYLAWRAESARLVGALTRMTRDVSLAEDLARTPSPPR
jgi:hypothetical protein